MVGADTGLARVAESFFSALAGMADEPFVPLQPLRCQR